VTVRGASGQEPRRTRPIPATTPEGREDQLISAAFDLAEKQILAGNASAQVISHFLKLGSSRERLEQQRLQYENELTEAKIEMMKSQANMEKLYENALTAMTAYKGETESHLDHDMDEYDD